MELNKAALEKPRQQPPQYLVVEGPIGVGKTTLALKLAEALNYPLLLESALDNPFLSQFYRNRHATALQTQLFFLLHRARKIAAAPREDLAGLTLVSDFLMEKDRLFAEITLNEHELALYEQIHSALALDPPCPDLVIYLQAPIEVLRKRIQRRGIVFEQNIKNSYLRSVAEAYTRIFHSYDSAPLLIINAAEVDFSANPHHLEALTEHISSMAGGRSYFNPHPKLI